MWKNIIAYTRRILRGIFMFCVFFMLYHCNHTIYGIQQLSGQVNILWNTTAIEEVLAGNEISEEAKEKIKLIQEIKQFAFDSLGINQSNSYSRFYNQKGQPILWVVTACKPYELKAQKWDFPIVGKFSYKGFFVKSRAENEAHAFKEQGYDTNIREVNAWSTLGWFSDPILSNFLDYKTGDLAELIIHELTHGTLYIWGKISYNENLATFIGEYGAIKFLKMKYGVDSKEYQTYMQQKEDRDRYTDYLLSFTQKLSKIYEGFSDSMSNEEKDRLKQEAFDSFKLGIKKVDFYNKGYHTFLDKRELNNTYFMSYLRYKKKQNNFKKEFEEEYNSNFPLYLKELKRKYGSWL